VSNTVYLDHAATTPLRREAREAMEPFLGADYGNPSSIYRLAQQSRSALDAARDTIAGCMNAGPSEIIFTSGATEGNNAAIKGAVFASRDRGRHIITTAIEHHSVLHPIEELTERFGFESTVVPVGPTGIVDTADVERAIRPDTTLISVMWANNEIGTIQPIEVIGQVARARSITMHVDAVQAAMTIPIDLGSLPVDLLTISAHKFYGPKGCGALYIRRGTAWWPLITGGGQERNRRAGTENVAGIAGMARAYALACAEREQMSDHLRNLRDLLLAEITSRIGGVVINGDMECRIPGNLNVSIDGVHGESLLVGLDLAGVMASSGSACTSGSLETSHVLRAIGLPDGLAQASLRLTVGRDNTVEQVRHAVDILEQLVLRLRRMAPAARGA
jgi:cysteine desulfurase